MNRQEGGLLTSLENLIVFTKYFGVHSLQYDTQLRKFQICKNLKLLKILWFTIVIIFNIYVSKLLTEAIPRKIFILHVGYYIYRDLYLMVLYSIIICDHIYEETTETVLNQLIQVQERLQQNDRIKILKLVLLTIICTKFGIDIFGVYKFTKTDGDISWDTILVIFNFVYISFIENLTELRFLLIFSILPVYFKHLSQDFNLSFTNPTKCNKIVKTHQELCWLARKINKTFSVPFLFLMGYYLSNMIINIIQNYYHMVFLNTAVNIFDIFQFSLALIMLFSLIIVANQCMTQANEFKKHVCKVLSKNGTNSNRKNLYAYGLQMFHEDLQINAAGFFVIEIGLIFAMISAAGTYVVIILQFLYSENQNVRSKNFEIFTNG
ncbi:gustatory receptor 162 [Tribolium castaneum]|uniref:Gustatory receptor n=1 Tax=Tribolium castaneum TaxID=7070 RepID=D6WC26_TRICA|nr:gustatory receptor 162 [Tribolium castaneum]